MRLIFCLCAVFLVFLMAPIRASDITTTGGQVYKSVSVTKADALGINITHESGAARVQFSKMSSADQKTYGYDPVKETAALAELKQKQTLAEQAAKDLAERRKRDLAAAKAKQEQQEAEEEQNRAARAVAQEKAQKLELARQEKARQEMFKPTDISIAAFHATTPATVTVFLARAKLADYYNYEFNDAKDTHWSVCLETPNGEDIGYGYMSKQGRGDALFAFLKDGKTHVVYARVRFPPRSRGSQCFFLEDYQEAKGAADVVDQSTNASE